MTARSTHPPPLAPEARPRGRALRLAARALGGSATFVAAILGGVVLHLGTPAARRLVAAQVNAALHGTFTGGLTIDRIGALSPRGATGVDVTVLDPEGRAVLVARGVSVRVSPLALALGARPGTGDLHLRLDAVEVDHLEAHLVPDPDGAPSLARAFDPAHPTPTDPAARGLDLELPRVVLHHAWAHGSGPVPVVDVELRELSGRVRVRPRRTEVEVAHLAVEVRALLGRPLAAEIEGALALPESPTPGNVDARARIHARAGDIDASLDAAMANGNLEAKLDVPQTSPEAIRALALGAAPGDAVALHLEARGAWPEIDLVGAASAGRGRVELTGHAALGDTLEGRATIATKELDLRALAPDLPASTLDLTTEARATRAVDGALTGAIAITARPSRVAGEVVPGLDARATFALPANGSPRAEGRVAVHEPGLPVAATFDLHPRGAEPEVAFTVDARAADLARVPRLRGAGVTGSATAHVAGTYRVSSRGLDGGAEVALEGVRAGAVALGDGRVTARASGTAARPRVDARFSGRDLDAGPLRFRRAAARVEGTAERAQVALELAGDDRCPDLRAHATVGVARIVDVKDAVVELTRGDTRARVAVPRARVAGSRIDVTGASLEGLGAPILVEVHAAPREAALSVEATDVDLARVAALAGLEQRLRGGTARLEAFLGLHAGRPYGEVDVQVAHVRWDERPPAWLTARGALDGRSARGALNAELDGVGLAAAQVNLATGGALDAASFARALGSVTLHAQGDLAALAELVPEEQRAGARAAGVVNLDATATREVEGLLPDARVTVTTRGLRLEIPPEDVTADDGTRARKGRAWVSSDIDLRAEASVDGASGLSELAFAAYDPRGALAYADAKADLPLAALAAGEADAERLRDAAFAAHLEVPLRALKAFPAAFGAPDADGEVALGIDARGTARAPRVDVGARALRLRAPDGARGTPLDVTARALWDGERASARAMVVRAGATVFDAYAAGRAPLADPAAWDASARARIDGFELGDVAWAVGERVRGQVSGVVALDRLHADPVAEASFQVRGLGNARAGGVDFDARARVDGKDASAAVDVRQPDGRGSVAARAPVTWRDGLVPALDPKRTVIVQYDLASFRLAPFAPFVRSAVGGLDGRLDGRGDVRIAGDFGTGQMNGVLVLRDGKAVVQQLGEELREIQAKVTIQPWGTIRVDDVSARATTGRVTAAAWARLDGLALRDAGAAVRIPEREPFPLAPQGVPLGEAWGEVDVRARSVDRGERLEVALDVPRLHMRLPETAGKSLQDLDPEATIVIGETRADGGVVRIPLDRAAWQEIQAIARGDDPAAAEASETALHLAVHLGDDVEIRRGTTLRLTVTGDPTFDIADGKTKAGGRVTVTRGFVELQGKRFDVERAATTFPDGDPANPMIVATAYYDAPDRTRVFADFRGTLKDGDVTLRSDPPHTKDEIVAILLFGSADGALGAASSSRQRNQGATATAVSAGGGVITQGLNRALSGVSPVEISTRIATNESNNPRPELAVQVAKNVTAKVGYNVGLPAPGQNPDRTMFILDWRFRPRWSMQTTVGDLGSTIVDFVWHKTY